MRIVLCDYSGHPFQIELSRCLAGRGHSVLHLHFAEFQTPKGEIVALPNDPPTFQVDAVSLGRPFAKDRFLRRRFQEGRIGRLIAERALQFGPDLVIGCNMPLDAQRRLLRACAHARLPFVFWLQDIYSAAIFHYLGQRLGLPGRIIGNHYRRLERNLLGASDAVVAISEKFLPTLAAWSFPTGRPCQKSTSSRRTMTGRGDTGWRTKPSPFTPAPSVSSITQRSCSIWRGPARPRGSRWS
jgi:hypothetical protein